jgi:hypothetical protein
MSEAKPSPPPEMSAQTYVEARWKEIGQMVLDAVPIEPSVRSIEGYLAERRRRLEESSLPDTFDWHFDLHLAETSHKFYLDWVPRNRALREDYTAFWRDTSKRMSEFTKN